MSHRFKIKFVALATATFAASALLGGLAFSSLTTVDGLPTGDHTGAHAAWVSTARTVTEQVMEADLVVRVQAIERKAPRHLWNPMPEGAERVGGKGTFAFTDTEMEILEVYRGDRQVGDRIDVMQTGGELTTRQGETSLLELAEDPLYLPGDEMVLFLVDISGDNVHAKGGSLFRTVNPAGRYQVEGGLVAQIPSEVPGAFAVENGDLADLEAEIRTAGAERAELERIH